MPTPVEEEKLWQEQIVGEAVQAAAVQLPDLVRLRNGGNVAHFSSNGFHTTDEDGNPVFEKYWGAGDVAGSAPV
jgi:hypothetical protein